VALIAELHPCLLSEFSAKSSLGAAVLGAGYSFPISEALSITPMIRIGYGIKDDDIPFYVGSVENGQPVQYQPSAKIEVDHFCGLQVRGEFQLNGKAYLFVEPSYSLVETKLSVNYRSVGLEFPDFSESDDREGFGIGAGAGVRFNDLISAELSYEIADLGNQVDMNTLSAQLRFSF
jgi:outer membrane autotransporter protein